MLAPPRPPSHDEFEALIPEARARQVRRRLLGAAGIAAVAALALGLYAVFGGTQRQSTSRSRAGAAAGLCRSSQISISVPGLSGVIEEGRTGLFVMMNKGSSPCTLPLRPPRATITRLGVPLPVRQVRGRGIVLASWQPLRTIHLLKPGDKAAISSYWQNWCGPPHSYRAMFAEHYRFDSRLTIALPIGPHPFCSDRRATSTIRVSPPLLAR